MVYVHFAGTVLLAVTLLKFCDWKSKKSVAYGLAIAVIAAVYLIILGVHRGHGTLMDVASMNVPHRTSAYLMGCYGLALAAAARLVATSRKAGGRKSGSGNGS